MILLLILITIGLLPYGFFEFDLMVEASYHHGDDDIVDQITTVPYSETQRMQLRGLIRLSSEIIAYYWPMRTFVHHNPLHGLEDLHFDEATRRAQQLLRWQKLSV